MNEAVPLLLICTAFLKISMVLLITRNAIGVQQAPWLFTWIEILLIKIEIDQCVGGFEGEASPHRLQ
ncbi:hypothetical protein [Pseudomonas frederiksbergensis]|uniref:hypothetical protein n=1 Tax=Pseudomonas frederiksbergensis TaxID=104087 RepID=UPI003D1EF527